MKKWITLGLFMALACSPPKQGGEDLYAGDTDAIGDVQAPEITQDAADQGPGLTDIGQDGWSRPKGYATLTFCVDDSANKTYKNGQLQWTGSFAWDKKTNTIKYASSWLPTDGPFIPLYDDGPMSKGGHESKCGKPGDHIFCAETYLKADKDYTIEYGVLDEYNHWVWRGPNGVVKIPKGSTEVYELDGLTMTAFGDTDFKVMLDTNRLNDAFSSVTPDKYDVYVKTSANSWTPVQLLDNGKKGDETAGDGVFTFQQSLNLGPHDGLCYKGQHVQFVFMFVMKGMDIDSAQEYKVGANCAADGVSAVTADKNGDFRPAKVVMERASRGRVFNTTIVVGGGNPWCKVDQDCFKGKCGDEGCVSGEETSLTITSVQPAKGGTDGGTAVEIRGTGFEDGASVSFGGQDATDVQVKDANTIQCKTPAHKKGAVDVTVTNPDGKTATLAQGFEFTEQTQETKVLDAVLDPPLTASTTLGVPTPDLKARVKTDGDGQGVQAECGYGPKGSDPADNTDWQFTQADYVQDSNGYGLYTSNLTINDAGDYAFTFRFKTSGDWVYADSTGLADGFDPSKLGEITVQGPVQQPRISSVIPDHGPTNAETNVEIEGSNFKDGAVVLLGDLEITPTQVTASKIQFRTPKHAMGLVDVTVKNPDGQTATQISGFAYVPKGTPVIDGVMNNGEWDASWLIAQNSLDTDVSGNELRELYVAFDNENLYLAIKGSVDADHYLIGYVDKDYGTPNGYNDLTQLTDNSGNGDLDDALSSIFRINDTQFAADLGFGTKGMASITTSDKVGDFPNVGWRVFSDPVYHEIGPSNFGWKKGLVVCGSSVVELSVPLRLLWGPEAARVPGRHFMAISVVISNAYGNQRVNQALPEKFDASDPMVLGDASFWIAPDNAQ